MQYAIRLDRLHSRFFFYNLLHPTNIYTPNGETNKLNIYMIILQLLGAIGMTIYAILNNLIPIISA